MKHDRRAVLQALLDDMHDQFITAVAQGRGLDRAAVRALADGRVYSGRRAKELGLVDALGGLEDAVRLAGALAKIPGKPKLVRPRRPFQLTDLLDWLGSRTPLRGFFTGGGPLAPAPWLGAPKLPLYVMD